MMILTRSKAVTLVHHLALLLLASVQLYLLPGRFNVVHCVSNKDYPLNLQEKSYLEKLSRRTFTARIDDGPDRTQPAEMLNILGKELIRLEADPKRDEEFERSLVLVRRYYDICQLSRDRCDEQSLEDLLFTVQSNQDNDKSALPLYLRDCAIRQFDLCQLVWDGLFLDAIDKLSPEVRDKMSLLLNYLIKPKPEDPLKPEFYTRELLNKLIKHHESHSLLVFLQQLGSLEGIADQDLKSIGEISFEQFSKIYDENIVDSLCSIVCIKLQAASDIYKLAYRADVMRYRKQDAKPVRTSDYLLEWLANKLICCDLTVDQKLKESAYKELTSNKP